MRQIIISQGSAATTDVPAPTIQSGEVLVRTRNSCLSVGTEMTSLRASGQPLWRRALRQPQKALRVFEMATRHGLERTWQVIDQQRKTAKFTGYSAAGSVIQVGAEVRDLFVGDRVACGGGGYAVHAEYIRVPRNLCVPIPDSVDWEAASTVSLGAIALQGIRRLQPTLGETFAVIGLGILGQITAQILRANGCRTIGVDLDDSRIALALQLGMDVGLNSSCTDHGFRIARLTDGLGADGAIITAATKSDDVVSQAFQLCRKKGRVVLVGDVGLNLDREDFYAKEIDFLISTSYGPGRYEKRYEEGGLDYPAAFVRWTENRNMAEYLRLLAEGRIEIDKLISARYSIEEATAAYESLKSGSPKPLMVLIDYPNEQESPARTIRLKSQPAARSHKGRIALAMIGAGGFAKSNHLPNIQSLRDRFELRAIVTRAGHNASEIALHTGAHYASTDYREILDDQEIDAVIIATRHNLHSTIALEALKAGKHVLVEKPLALAESELAELDALVTDPERPTAGVLMTGYNRRFSSYAESLSKFLADRAEPVMINYRMNAGYISPEHWVQGPEGGGRNLGEACHIYDLFTFLIGSEVASVAAKAIRPNSDYYGPQDNFSATLAFHDGSTASLLYTALGHPHHPKEMAEFHVEGKTAVLEDYRRLEVLGAKQYSLSTRHQEKGWRQELVAFADAINTGNWPMPWWQQKQACTIAFSVERQLLKPDTGQEQPLP